MWEVPGKPPYFTFTNNHTGSTMLLPADKASPEAFKAKVDAKRAEFAQYQKQTEAFRPAWGKVKLALMSDDVESSVDPLYCYGSIKLSQLPELASRGAVIRWAESLRTAQRYAEPDAVPLKAPRRLAQQKPFLSGQHIEALTSAGWQRLKQRGKWIEVEPGKFALDGPSRASWSDRQYQPSRALLSKYPQLDTIRVREHRGVEFLGALADGAYASLQIMRAATRDNHSAPDADQVERDLNPTRLLDTLLLRNKPQGKFLLLWCHDALPQNLEMVVELSTGKVLFAAHPFPPGAEPVRYRMAVLCEERGQVWAIKPTGKSAWYLPGGHKDAGETRGAAAVREMLEESGIKCRLQGVVGEIHRPEFTTIVFRATVVSRGIPSTLDEIEEVALIDPKQLDISERYWVLSHLE
jgi:ADP-ribose pyrophosphatase YjhB (NUDIX family)